MPSPSVWGARGDVYAALFKPDWVTSQTCCWRLCAACVKRYLERKHLRCITDWPPYSPDLNVIEQVWALLKVRTSNYHPSNVDELKIATQKAWDSITQNEINVFCRSYA